MTYTTYMRRKRRIAWMKAEAIATDNPLAWYILCEESRQLLIEMVEGP